MSKKSGKTLLQQNAKMLFKPRFLDDTGTSYFLNDVDTDKAKKVIAPILKEIFPEFKISRNGSSNFYMIDAGGPNFPTPPIEYFAKLQKFGDTERSVTISMKGKPDNISALLDFYNDDLPAGLTNKSGTSITKANEIDDLDLPGIKTQLSTSNFTAYIADVSSLPTDNVYFNGEMLLGAHFKKDVINSEFMFCNLICANFTGANFTGLNVSGSLFEEADLRYADFSRGKLTKDNFQHANLTGAIFEGATIKNMLAHAANFKNANCKGATFINCDFTGAVHFSGADLTDAVFEDCDFAFAQFIGTNLTGTKFIGKETNFLQTDFKRVITSATTEIPSSVDLKDKIFDPAAIEFVGQPKKIKTKKTKTKTAAAQRDTSVGGKRKRKTRKYTIKKRRSSSKKKHFKRRR